MSGRRRAAERIGRRAALGMLAAVLALAGARAGAAEAAAPTTPEVQAWRNNAQYLAREAQRAFTRLARDPAEAERSTRLGLALSRLSEQPVPAETLAGAGEILRQLAETDDEYGRAARYFLGRIAQNFQEPPDYPAAEKIFRELIARSGDSYWGQAARGKLALLILYALPAENAAARIAGVEALLDGSQGATTRDLHLLIADAMLYYGLPKETALAHLLTADSLSPPGALAEGLRADMLVQIVDLSARTGRLAQAETYAARFAHEYPRDWRNSTIRAAELIGIRSPAPQTAINVQQPVGSEVRHDK